jgi:hypothetical protein
MEGLERELEAMKECITQNSVVCNTLNFVVAEVVFTPSLSAPSSNEIRATGIKKSSGRSSAYPDIF